MSHLNYLEKLLDGVEVVWLPLGDIAEIYGGLTGKSKADFESGNAKYISYKNIFNNIDVDPDQLELVKLSKNERQNKVRYGDILFTGSSEIAVEAGMSSAVTIDFKEPVYLNSFSFGVRFNDDIKLMPEFSKYLFRSRFMRSDITKSANGVTRFNVSKARFKKILVPIPCPDNPEKSLAIQSEIVRILDKFTALTAELTAELNMRKKQYNYYRDQLLSFEEGEVEWKTLGEICESITSGKNKDKSETGKFPVYGSTGVIGRTNTKAYETEQILVARVGANAGRVNIASGKYDVSDNTLILKVKNKYNLKFLYYYLVNLNLNRFVKGAGQPLLTAGQLKAMVIPVPMPEEQSRIVSILDNFDIITNSITEGLPREIELRQKQYEYYRDLLLNFPKSHSNEVA
ncbi:restriction endonuclease subunit S [Providencia stuartii]|uniref:restriction endonuclease subunit S n=1 Tax=Providencia TaxID=586 RepID=UPI00146C7BB2|nr:MULTISPECIES: restriction endonuclease subunit S [Providencia]NMT50256.1 restriction endonuclease subunit S [Providencia stuartii]